MQLYGRAIKTRRACLELPCRRGGKAPRKHLPQCKHRPRQRTEARLCLDGNRHLGSHCSGKNEAFWLHAVLSRAGLGGHCIPIDPFYLTWKAREFEHSTRFIELAGEINTAMPDHVVHRVGEALNHAGKAVKGSRILILGLAYKPNVDDERESPSYRLLEKLKQRGAIVAYHDPHIPVIRPTREHPHWAGTKSVPWTRPTISGFDLVLIATAHACVNYQELADWAQCIIDTRNVMASVNVASGKVWKA